MDENGGGKTSYQINKKKGPQKGGLAKFLWNSDTGEFMGRNGTSWFKITVFYLIFYFFLGCFFLLCYHLFSLTLEENRPKWTGNENIIGTNPGIGFRPMPDTNKNEMSSLVWMNKNRDMVSSYWGNELDDYLKKTYSDELPKKCSFGGDNSTDSGACDIDYKSIRECNANNNMYGFTGEKAQPCFLIKLNKIFDWVPKPYLNNEEDLKLAEDRKMPAFLIDRIKTSSDNERKTTWISCQGKNPHDREFLKPDMLKYYAPGFTTDFPGIPNYYFPFTNQENGYETPFVFVKFMNLPMNVLLQIECKAWAKNIEANQFDRTGSVHFEILYSDKDGTV